MAFDFEKSTCSIRLTFYEDQDLGTYNEAYLNGDEFVISTNFSNGNIEQEIRLDFGEARQLYEFLKGVYE